jgi:hypothetical protein
MHGDVPRLSQESQLTVKTSLLLTRAVSDDARHLVDWMYVYSVGAVPREDAGERRQAAAMCTGCPVFDPCGEAAESRGESLGFGAGVDRTPAAEANASIPLAEAKVAGT